MEGLHIFLALLFGVVSHSHGQLSGPVLEVTVRPGDNITVYCDCKLSTGVYIMWYRNCSHENQPPLVLKTYDDTWRQINNAVGYLNPLPRLHFVRNYSSQSYDLLIMNSTDSDEGLYYCGTEEMKLEDKNCLTRRYDYKYGNVRTRIIISDPDSSESSLCPDSSGSSDVSWMMMFTPVFTALSSFVAFIYVYHLCQPTDKEAQVHQRRLDTRGQTRQNQDEDVFLTRVVYRAQDG